MLEFVATDTMIALRKVFFFSCSLYVVVGWMEWGVEVVFLLLLFLGECVNIENERRLVIKLKFILYHLSSRVRGGSGFVFFIVAG